MKVKSFKLIPGVLYNGADETDLHRAVPKHLPPPSPDPGAEAEPTENSTTKDPPTVEQENKPIGPPKLKDTDSDSYQDKYLFSVDGERLNPGHGIICEVHQG